MTTIDRAILEELLMENLQLVLMALGDAAAWRLENGTEEESEAYSKLQGEIEEWVFD